MMLQAGGSFDEPALFLPNTMVSVADLGQEALPVFLVAAVGLFQVFEDAFEVGVAAEIAPGWDFC